MRSQRWVELFDRWRLGGQALSPVAGRTFRLEMCKAVPVGVIETAGSTFLMLIAVRFALNVGYMLGILSYFNLPASWDSARWGL